MKNFKINKKNIGVNSRTYFIADIAANHDGSLHRAKKLIKLCAKAGADAAKFQHFKAETIVLDKGFKKIGKLSHQKKWSKSVFQVYKKASINPNWNEELRKECLKNNIDFLRFFEWAKEQKVVQEDEQHCEKECFFLEKATNKLAKRWKMRGSQ